MENSCLISSTRYQTFFCYIFASFPTKRISMSLITSVMPPATVPNKITFFNSFKSSLSINFELRKGKGFYIQILITYLSWKESL